ncbi:MAG: hypothetical protein IIA87_00680 [Nanoarchaeota archaeon]|nr:hypothetical protein [Nanoarchaeota archaeon]
MIKKRFGELFLVVGILIFIIAGLEFSVAQVGSGYSYSDKEFSGSNRGSASFVNYGAPPDFQKYYSSEGRLSTYFPVLADRDSCFARQDILLQVAPVGCQPAVVRSDLLAEQNVPVFCQLDAIKVNPLLDIKQIRSIRFRGDYPKEVVGVGFHPARAALRTRDKLLGSPLINNIGYVVVVLKRNPNEEELPNFINFTLSARLDYYSGNALGIGKSEFLLREVTDAEWKSERNRQSFFKGQYFARLIDADPNFATIAIYHGERKISTTRVQRGKSSEDIYVPGQYCQVALKLSYDGFVSADKIAKIRIDDEIIDVYRGSRFLNGKCQVKSINGDSTNGTVEISCGGSRSFTLGLQARFLKVGDLVNYTKGDRDLWEITEINEKERQYNITKYSNEGVIESKVVNISDVFPEVSDVLFEARYTGETKEYFKKAIDSYEEVVDSYAREKKSEARDIEGTPTYGELALGKAIELASDFKKEATEARLIEKFIDVYPDADNSSFYTSKLNELYTKDSSLAGTVIDIDNDFKTIKLLEIRIPAKRSSAEFVLGVERITLQSGESHSFISIGDKNGLVIIEKVEFDKVKVTSYCGEDDRGNREWSKSIRIGESETSCGVSLRLVDVNLEEFARVKISPVVRTTSETEFTVGVGIEKRAIKLSPDKTKEKIENLNKSIKKWESISNNLGDVVRGLKGACFATAGVLTVKNFFTGFSGESLARQKVMRGSDGWTEWCKDRLKPRGQYDTLTQCYNDKASQIKKDVDAYAKAISQSNKKMKAIEDDSIISSGGFFGGDSIDIDEAKKDLVKVLESECSSVSTGLGGENGDIGKLIAGVKLEDLGYQQLRDMYFNCLVVKGGQLSSGGVGLNRANEDLKLIGERILERKETSQVREGLGESLKRTGLEGFRIVSYGGENAIRGEYYGGILKPGDINNVDINNNTPAQVITYDGDPYLIILQKTSVENYRPEKIYALTRESNYKEATLVEGALASKIRRIHIYRKIDAGSYNNRFAKGEDVVRYYEREPYKGTPAIVPIDVDEGWYVATKQTLPGFGKIKAFESSGRPVSFWVCNIMQDKKVGFFSPGFGDDKCVQFNMNTGQPLDKFPGLSERKTRQLVDRAVQALEDAAKETGKKKGELVNILGRRLSVGGFAASIPGTQCQDFMSPEDCLKLFNVCDPVICPSSRCNLGGTYYVSDVIQSGVIGSVLLCLPNFKEGILVPVCLTGIKAGIDGYLSILKSHQQCLQENLETGRTIGICDLVTSVYTCEFFWRQAAPVANVLLPKAVEFLYTGGQGQARGGGEYLTVQTAWENAQDSVNFFTQEYAANSLEAFRVRSIAEAGTTLCRAFVSVKGPKSFETLIEPDSPPQFHAWFSSIPFSDATVPATAQYKVFYHIFSGDDSGVAFSVYLKDPPETSFYYTTPTLIVASGFAPRGQFATETRDFTAPEGYKQLCVRINNKEECGFKQVSSSFALNIIRDEFVSDEIERGDITRESECISGKLNVAALLNPNIQEAAQEAIDPAVYNRGVVRICATDNPGKGTEPERFVDAGYCDDQRVRCWVDMNSVERALTVDNIGEKEKTIEKLEARQKELLQEGKEKEFYSETKASEVSERLRREKLFRVSKDNVEGRIDEIDNDLEKVFFNYQRAEFLLLKGDVYAKVAKNLLTKLQGVLEIDPSGGVEDKKEKEENIELLFSERFSLRNSEDDLIIRYKKYQDSTLDNTELFVPKDTKVLVYKTKNNVVADLSRTIDFSGKGESVIAVKENSMYLRILDDFDLVRLDNAKILFSEDGSLSLKFDGSGN